MIRYRIGNNLYGKKGIILKLKDFDILRVTNLDNFNIVKEKIDFKTDIRMYKLTHMEFPTVREGEQYEEYWLEDARKKFPYLFVNTNPLLYRRFYHKDSWRYYEKENNRLNLINSLFKYKGDYDV